MSYTEIQDTDLNETLSRLKGLRGTRKHVPPKVTLGMRPTPKKVRQYFLREFVRTQQRHPDLSDQEVFAKALEALKKSLSAPDAAVEAWSEMAPSLEARPRGDAESLVEIAAMRRTSYAEVVESHLRTREETRGRKSDHAVPIAILEENCWEAGVPQLKRGLHQFFRRDSLAQYAFGYPFAQGGPMQRQGVGSAMAAILDRNDPDIPIAANIAAIQNLQQFATDRSIGKYCAIDGTSVEALVPQQQSYSDSEADLLNGNDKRARPGNNKQNTASYKEHGKERTSRSGKKTRDTTKRWRGYTLLTITCMKSSIPLVTLLTSEAPAWRHIDQMLQLLFEFWPECPMESLAGDKEFDTEQIMEMLYRTWSVAGVMAFNGEPSADHKREFDLGTPRCCENEKGENHDGLMRIASREGFVLGSARLNPTGKRWVPRRGVPMPWADERIRWKCPRCGRTRDTRPRHNPRLFTFHPRTGSTKAAYLSAAIGAYRNVAETFNSVLKRTGLAGVGSGKSQWIKTDREMAWVINMAVLGFTLRRLIHYNGLYDSELEKVVAAGAFIDGAGELLINNSPSKRSEREKGQTSRKSLAEFAELVESGEFELVPS